LFSLGGFLGKQIDGPVKVRNGSLVIPELMADSPAPVMSNSPLGIAGAARRVQGKGTLKVPRGFGELSLGMMRLATVAVYPRPPGIQILQWFFPQVVITKESECSVMVGNGGLQIPGALAN
jgi:hypothetical protein